MMLDEQRHGEDSAQRIVHSSWQALGFSPLIQMDRFIHPSPSSPRHHGVLLLESKEPCDIGSDLTSIPGYHTRGAPF